MKRLFCFIALAVIAVSCSKEQRINRRLDGTWKVSMYENQIISPQTRFEYSFIKDKKGKGSAKRLISYPGFSEEIFFDYEIKGEDITYLFGDTASITYHVADRTKNKVVLVNKSNEKVTNLRRD